MQKEEKVEFDINHVIKCLQEINKYIKEESDVPFDAFCQILDQFCIVFKQLNSFLGVAFSDVKEKVRHIKANCGRFPDHRGFISFIKMQIEKKIHVINGKDNAKKKVPQQFATYSSTARSLLRMMWLLTFIRVTFYRCKQFPEQNLSSTFSTAYDEAFGNNHSWIIRKSAKVAMMTSQNKKRLVEVILKENYNQQLFKETNNRFLVQLIPVHDFLWKFYKQQKLEKLE